MEEVATLLIKLVGMVLILKIVSDFVVRMRHGHPKKPDREVLRVFVKEVTSRIRNESRYNNISKSEVIDLIHKILLEKKWTA